MAQATENKAKLQDELTSTYRPIINGAGLAGVCYFIFNAIKRIGFSDGLEQIAMGALAVTFGLASLVMFLWTRKPRSAFQLELWAAMICAVLLTNSVTHMVIRFQQENLVYFAIMMPLFALLTPRLSVSLAWTAICVACLLGFVAANIPDQLFEYVSVAIACIVGAVGATMLVRRALLNALAARLEADQQREEAERNSTRDALTDLPNRRKFFEDFNARRQALARTGQRFGLIVLDLDGFKPVNDVYGHAAGDQLLRAVAGRLQAVCPDDALPARVGGDEFAILVGLSRRGDDIRRLATQIIDALALPYTLEAGVVRVSASAGAYICRRTDLDPGAMIERADHALYRAKSDRRGDVVVFSDQHEEDLVNVHHVDRALRKADLKTELSLVFQPQFDIQTRRVSGFEALARWTSPELGPVSPDVFIAAAERTNQMRRVTQFLLGKALQALETLPEHLRLSVNLSAHDLMSEGGVRHIIEQVRLSGVDPSRLEFEITETAMLTDQDFVADSLAELQRMGVSIALDDFGSGYSNFAYLQKLQISKLKIDRSFVQPLLSEPAAAKILSTLVSLTGSLGLVCVVEGIEKPEEMARVREFGARYIQGYLLARPMPQTQIPAFLAGIPDWIEEMRRAEADIGDPVRQESPAKRSA